MRTSGKTPVSIRVGFIGLGLMGQGMAKNIIHAGFEITVHDILYENMKPLLKLGAKAADSSRKVASSSEVVIIMARNDAQVESIIYSETGVLSGLAPDSTIIVMSTVSPALVQRIASDAQQSSISVLDAAVSGIAQVAEAGELTIMVGGDNSALQKHKAILEAMGSEIFHIGDIGTGMVCKLLNNAIAGANIMTADECLAAGVRAGIELEKLLQVFTTTTARSWTIDNWAAIAEMKRSYQPDSGPLALIHKDLGLLRSFMRDQKIETPLVAIIEKMAKNL